MFVWVSDLNIICEGSFWKWGNWICDSYPSCDHIAIVICQMELFFFCFFSVILYVQHSWVITLLLAAESIFKWAEMFNKLSIVKCWGMCRSFLSSGFEMLIFFVGSFFSLVWRSPLVLMRRGIWWRDPHLFSVSSLTCPPLCTSALPMKEVGTHKSSDF